MTQDECEALTVQIAKPLDFLEPLCCLSCSTKVTAAAVLPLPQLCSGWSHTAIQKWYCCVSYPQKLLLGQRIQCADKPKSPARDFQFPPNSNCCTSWALNFCGFFLIFTAAGEAKPSFLNLFALLLGVKCGKLLKSHVK